jgi:hypothetical protein
VGSPHIATSVDIEPAMEETGVSDGHVGKPTQNRADLPFTIYYLRISMHAEFTGDVCGPVPSKVPANSE